MFTLCRKCALIVVFSSSQKFQKKDKRYRSEIQQVDLRFLEYVSSNAGSEGISSLGGKSKRQAPYAGAFLLKQEQGTNPNVVSASDTKKHL